MLVIFSHANLSSGQDGVGGIAAVVSQVTTFVERSTAAASVRLEVTLAAGVCFPSSASSDQAATIDLAKAEELRGRRLTFSRLVFPIFPIRPRQTISQALTTY